MNPVIAVGWRGGDAHREAAWQFTRAWYEPLGWPIIATDSGDEPFSRSKSRNLATRLADLSPKIAGRWDVALLLDADCLVDLDVVRAGMKRAHDEQRLILPHTGYVPLTRSQTERLYAGTWQLPPANRLFMPRFAPGGLVIVPRPVWDALGGYDPKFVGWGSEDSDLLTRYMTLTGDRIDRQNRMKARIWHLWHPSENPLTLAEQVKAGEVAA